MKLREGGGVRILRAFGILLALGAFSFAWAQDGGVGAEDPLVFNGERFELTDEDHAIARAPIAASAAAEVFERYCVDGEAPLPEDFTYWPFSPTPAFSMISSQVDLFDLRARYNNFGWPNGHDRSKYFAMMFWSLDNLDAVEEAFESFEDIEGFSVSETQEHFLSYPLPAGWHEYTVGFFPNYDFDGEDGL